MGRRFLFLVAGLVSIAVIVKRNAAKAGRQTDLRAAEAQWANEGGANPPATV